MKQILDESHELVIQRWNTFQKIQQCGLDIDNYLIEIAEDVINRLRDLYGEKVVIVDKLRDEKWFDVFPKELNDLSGEGSNPLTFGLENINVANLAPESLQKLCRAYVYWRNGREGFQARIFEKVGQLLTASPPTGFHVAIDNPSNYFCLKQFSPAPEEIINPNSMLDLIISPLIVLVDWYEQNKASGSPNRA